MFSHEERVKAIQLFLKYDCSYAAVNRGSMKILFHWLNSKLLVKMTLFVSYQSLINWKSSSAPSLVKGTYPISSRITNFTLSNRCLNTSKVLFFHCRSNSPTSSDTRQNRVSIPDWGG